MPALELYGKCKELGYCDCGGFFGCVDPSGPKRAPKDEAEIRNAMKAEASVADYKNHNLKRELDAAGRRQTLCEACGKQKRSNHNCKGARPAGLPPATPVRWEKPKMPKTVDVPNCRDMTAAKISDVRHNIVIELPGIRITIEPVEETNGHG